MSRSAQDDSDDARLQRLLGGSELAALRQRLRRHFERRDVATSDGLLHLSKLTAHEQEALSLLCGRAARPSATARVDVGLLNTLLKNAGIAPSLRAALEQLDGPIGNPTADKQALQARWEQTRSAPRSNTSLVHWLQQPSALSLLKRLTRQEPDAAARMLERTDAVLQRLPAQGLTRAQLAADTLGNAHGLDNGQAIATLVLAVLQGAEHAAPSKSLSSAWVEGDDAAVTAEDTPAESARAIWARAGVLVNELARPALFLNLPVPADGPFQPQAGEPGYLSLRQLLRTPVQWAVAQRVVFVCENPNIVSIAADRLGAACAPLVCTDGMPAAAQRVLLTQLAQAGAHLLYHGDFDWAGLQIGNQVMALCAAKPWRFDCVDYEQSVATAPHSKRDLIETKVIAKWNAQLASTMQLHGLSIAEEAVVAKLLVDLQSACAPTPTASP